MNHNHDVASELQKRKKGKKKIIEQIKRIHHNDNNDGEAQSYVPVVAAYIKFLNLILVLLL